MNVIYVASKLPYPLTSGLALRQFHLLRAYAAIARVDVVFFDDEPDALASCAPLLALGSRLHPIAPDRAPDAQRRSGIGRWLRRLEYLTASRPYEAVRSYSETLRHTVQHLAASADLVHVARLHMVPHVESLLRKDGRRPALILDLDEIETVARARRLKAGLARSPKALLLESYDMPRLWWYQRTAVRLFDRVLVCSEKDRARLGCDTVSVIPNGADSPATNRDDRSDGKTILYCGQLSWGPNADAAVFLVKEILPRVQQTVSGARVLIVGSSPPPHVRALDDGRSVVLRADVPSVAEYYEQATVAAVPLRAGGGTRLKILEALSRRVPVVSTTIGCEGLDVTDRKHLLIADDPRAFADRCIELLTSPSLRGQLADAGALLIAQRYTWTSIEARLATIADELLRDLSR